MSSIPPSPTSNTTSNTDSQPSSPLTPSPQPVAATTSPRPSELITPIFTMASPVKTAPPTALDRQFGTGDHQLSAPSLPLPGLSGRANSSTGGEKQATCSRDPLTTTESSRAPRSLLASNLTLRPKSTSPPESAVTSSWGFTRCGFHQQQQQQPDVSNSHNNYNDNTNTNDTTNDSTDHNNKDSDALITGLFFLGGSKSDDGSEFQFGNIRVHLQTSSQGFVIGAGRGSISILRLTLRFTLDFMDEKDFGLDLENESIKNKKGHNTKGMGGTDHGRTGGLDGQHSLSLSLTMTITIMAINSTSLS
ncbi:hypothetical protein F4678DRAFT_54524 [Xylaria arbuscula]|nr:hypothetical protein F4678DRAFT_54524 [Xylaria arbuscula]